MVHIQYPLAFYEELSILGFFNNLEWIWLNFQFQKNGTLSLCLVLFLKK
jgi:hypothetical protein